MYTIALQKAEVCLKRCKKELETIKESTKINGRTAFDFDRMPELNSFEKDLPKIAERWSDFLIAANRFFERLEEGSKSSGKCEAWYGRVTHQRRKDELLKYIHQARNSDEHGLANIIGLTSIRISNTSTDSQEPIACEIDPSTGNISSIYVPPNSAARIRMPDFVVVEVHNKKYGTTCTPPTMHKGQEISDWGLECIGSLALSAMTEILEEAQTLPIIK